MYRCIDVYRLRPRSLKGASESRICSISAFELGMGSHGPTCGCPFCVTLGRIHFFVTHPCRHRDLIGVATSRLRLLYTDFVDLAEGFVGAREIHGQPLIPDPRPPPGTGSGVPGPPVGPLATPAGGSVQEAVQATTTKAAPPVPAVPPAEPRADCHPKLPETGECATSPRPRAPSTEAPRSSKDKKPKEEEKSSPGKSEKKERRSRHRSRSRQRAKKRDRRTKSAESKRERSRSRRRRRASGEERRDRARSEEIVRVKEEPKSPEEPPNSVREPPRPPSREEGRREDRSRAPLSPPGPPPDRPQWSGPIRAARREPYFAEEERDRGEWPKSKGVKRRERNRAFREANYPPRWVSTKATAGGGIRCTQS